MPPSSPPLCRTFVSELINAGLYIFNPSVFALLPGEKASMNALLPSLANEGLLHHFESRGYWVKMTDVRTFLSAVGPQLEMMRLLAPHALAPHSGAEVPASVRIVGNVLIARGAVIGEGCKLGPDVVIGCARRAPAQPRARSPALTPPPPAVGFLAGPTACSRRAAGSRRPRSSRA